MAEPGSRNGPMGTRVPEPDGQADLEAKITIPDSFLSLSPELQTRARAIYVQKMVEAVKSIQYSGQNRRGEFQGAMIALKYFREVFAREAVVEAQARLEAEKTEEKGNYDELTGLHGEKPFFRNLTKAMEELEDPRFNERRCLVMISFDVDFFKAINDNPSLGHGVGDEVLKAVAEVIRKQTRPGDLFCRASSAGDEFMIALRNVPIFSVEGVIRRIHTALSKITAEDIADSEIRERAINGGLKHVSVSMGVLVMEKNSQVGVVGARTESDHAANVTKGKGKGGYTIVMPGKKDPFVMVRRLEEDSGTYNKLYEDSGYPIETKEDREYHVLRLNQRVLEEIDLAIREGKMDAGKADEARQHLIAVGGILHEARG